MGTPRILATAAIGGLCAPLLVFGAAASDAAPTRPVVLEGKVLADAAADIEAVVWPNQDVLDSLPVGAEVPLLRLSEADISVSGNEYAVRMDPNSVPARYRSLDGVDIQVSGADETGGYASYEETVSPRQRGWARAEAARALAERGSVPDHERPGVLALRRNSKQGPATRPAPSLKVRTSNAAGPSGDASRTETAGVRMAADPICSIYKTAKTRDKKVKISDVMPAKRKMKGRVKYKVGARHTIGTAYKRSNGSVSAGGSITRSRGASTSLTPEYKATDYTAKTYWRFRDYKNSCTQTRHRRPESHQGGYYTPTRSRPRYKYCRRYQPTTWSRTTDKAWTYRHGVSLFGLGISAQAGYTEEVVLQYRFKNKARYLCGNNANPGQAKLVAGYGKKQ